jgi:hypothetical protein
MVINEGINGQEVDAWIDTIKYYSRATPYLKINDNFMQGLKKYLNKYTAVTKEQIFEYKGNYKFYTNQKVKISLFKVKSFFFELTIFGLIVGYVSLIYIYLHGLTNTKNNFFSFFNFKRKV